MRRVGSDHGGDGASDQPNSGQRGTAGQTPVVALSPEPADWLVNAVLQAGARIGALEHADALIHRGGPDGLPALPDTVRWVQLSSAGIERFLVAGVIDEQRVWTSAAGAYADQVAEHALGLLLAGVRGLVTAAAQREWRPDLVAPRVSDLSGSAVAVVGAGGIGRRIIELLAPHRVLVVAVNRSGRPVAAADRTVPVVDIDEVWGGVDHVIVAAPATAATQHLIDSAVLDRLKPTSWVINVARGSLIDTDALLSAVRGGQIAGAGLDVTDPEPLPADHPLWTTPGILITPHTANPGRLGQQALSTRIRENLARFAAGRPLVGRIDLRAGY